MLSCQKAGENNQDIVCNEYWEGVFVARFIQNTRASFDYLEMLSAKNYGEISVEEINSCSCFDGYSVASISSKVIVDS